MIKAFLLTIVFVLPLCLFSQEKPPVHVETVSDLNTTEVSMAYRFMVADFLKSGGEGRTFLVKTDYKDVAGYYFAVDKLPSSFNIKGVSLFTRDPKVLQGLKNAQKGGVPLFLESIDHDVDAQVFGDDELGRSLRLAAFPSSKANLLLSVSPTATEDVLIHEMAHIKHKSTSHPFSIFLNSHKETLSEAQLGIVRRALTELGAYQEQYATLETMKKQGRVNMLTVIKDSSGHHVEVARFNDIYKKQMEEIRANSGTYMGSISSTLRKHPRMRTRQPLRV